MNLLGLDIGKKRTGVAISAGLLAHEYATLVGRDQLIDALREICEEEKIDKIIIGLPKHKSGEPSNQTNYVLELGQSIREALKRPVIYGDEFLTTAEARRILTEMGVEEKKITARLDQFSAQIILQQYLDNLAS